MSAINITMLDLMKLVENSEFQIEIETPDGFQPVGDFFIKGQKKSLELLFTDGTILECSKDHLIQVPSPKAGYDNPQDKIDNHYFSKAKWLNIGDKVCSKDGEKTLEKWTYIDYHHVYDIEVKHENHRFYANDVIHHNSGGKTTLVMQTCREAKKKGIVIFIDNEQTFDYAYAQSMGLVEDDNFVVYRPMNAEEVEDIILSAIDTLGDAIAMIAIDSVASVRTKTELETMQGESSQKSAHAFFWGSFSAKLVQLASKHKIAVVLINQLRSKPSIGSMDKYSIGNTGMGSGYSNTDTGYNTCVTYDTTVTVLVDGQEQIVTMSELKFMNKEILIKTPDGFQPIGAFVDKGIMKVRKYIFSNGKSVNATATHRFQKVDETWVWAKDCNIGDIFISQDGNTILTDISNEWEEPVCDIEILHPNHRYFTNGISSHNTGGTALKFYLSARYLLRFSSTLKEQQADDFTGEIEDIRVANIFKIESIKNKCFPPFKKAKYVIRFGKGTDDSSIIKDYLVSRGVISTKGSFISYTGTTPEKSIRVNGKYAFDKAFRDPNVYEDAVAQYLKLKTSGASVVHESQDDIWTQADGEDKANTPINVVDEEGNPTESFEV